MTAVLQEIEQRISEHNLQAARSLIAQTLQDDAQSDSMRARLLICRARMYLIESRPENSLQDLNTVTHLHPALLESPDVRELRADSHLLRFEHLHNRRDILDAQAEYLTILEGFPQYSNLGWVCYQLGRCHLALDEIDTAISYLQTAINHRSIREHLKAYCYERLGFIEFYNRRQFKKAAEFLKLALAVYPPEDSPAWLATTHLLYARALHAHGQIEASIQSVETAVEIATTRCHNEQKLLSEIYLSAGTFTSQIDWQEQLTIDYLSRFLHEMPPPLQAIDVTWSRVHEMIGHAHFKLQDYATAAKVYEIALQYNPNHPLRMSIHYRLAQCYYQQGSYEAAIAVITRLIKAAEAERTSLDDYRVYDIIGNAHFALGRYDVAESYYQKAIQLAPVSAEGLEKIKLYYHFSRQLQDTNKL